MVPPGPSTEAEADRMNMYSWGIIATLSRYMEHVHAISLKASLFMDGWNRMARTRHGKNSHKAPNSGSTYGYSYSSR